jgi:hypothetical protein
MAYWRLTLDPPSSWATEPGALRTPHCGKFVPDNNGGVDPFFGASTWREPVNGTLMLTPSFQSRDFGKDFHPLTDFRYSQPTSGKVIWVKTQRTQDLLTTSAIVYPSGYDPTADFALTDLMTSLAIVVIQQALASSDNMVWALESNYYLPQDGSFAIHYNSIRDELARKQNWFELQWANIWLHFSQTGVCRVYQGDPTLGPGTPPTQIHQFDFGNPGELAGRPGYLIFIPMPGAGLLFVNASRPPHSLVNVGNVESIAVSGHMIPFPTQVDNQGNFWMFAQSKLRIGWNPYQDNAANLGVQDVTFGGTKGTGTYLDATFDPGYTPSHGPDAGFPIPLVYPTEAFNLLGQTATAQLMKPDGSAPWQAGIDRQGRVQIALTTPNKFYTPFVYGYGVQWAPVFNNRNPGQIVLSNQALGQGVDTLTRLEYSYDEYGRFEGTVHMNIMSAGGRAIADRGDSTFLLEVSLDGVSWQTVDGGYTSDWNNDAIITRAGWHYQSNAVLKGMWWRLEEVHNVNEMAFDNVTPGDAINNVILAAGFAQIPRGNIPDLLLSFQLPGASNGQRWRFAPREGDTGGDVVKDLLLLSRMQKTEWLVLYSWPLQAWQFEQKSYNPASIWVLQPYVALQNAGNQVWSYGVADELPKFKPEPPEANYIVAEGKASNDALSERVYSAPIVNYRSLNNTLLADGLTPNPDYLGRQKKAVASCAPMPDEGQLNIMVRRVYDAAAHRRLKISGLPIAHLQFGLVANQAVQLLDDAGNNILFSSDNAGNVVPYGWIKKSTIIVEGGIPGIPQETMLLDLSTQWEGEIG